MARRPFDVTTVKSLSQFGFGQSKVDREAEEKLKKEAELRDMMPKRIPSSDVGQGFSMEEGLNPWEIVDPTKKAILICPNGCCVDVEEIIEPPVGAWKSDGELVAGSYPKFKSAFCYCPKCQTRFFIVELVKWKSWRREL